MIQQLIMDVKNKLSRPHLGGRAETLRLEKQLAQYKKNFDMLKTKMDYPQMVNSANILAEKIRNKRIRGEAISTAGSDDNNPLANKLVRSALRGRGINKYRTSPFLNDLEEYKPVVPSPQRGGRKTRKRRRKRKTRRKKGKGKKRSRRVIGTPYASEKEMPIGENLDAYIKSKVFERDIATKAPKLELHPATQEEQLLNPPSSPEIPKRSVCKDCNLLGGRKRKTKRKKKRRKRKRKTRRKRGGNEKAKEYWKKPTTQRWKENPIILLGATGQRLNWMYRTVKDGIPI